MARSASATDMIPYDRADEAVPHGGDLDAARRQFPDAIEPFIDLSTGINPNPYPLPRFPAGPLRPTAAARGRRDACGDRRAGLWRALGGARRARAGHAAVAAAGGRADPAGPRGSARAELRRICPHRSARRAPRETRARTRRLRRRRSGHGRQSKQSRRQASRQRCPCSRWPKKSAGRATAR